MRRVSVSEGDILIEPGEDVAVVLPNGYVVEIRFRTFVQDGISVRVVQEEKAYG